MAIETRHTGLIHLAAREGGELVVLILDLSVRIPVSGRVKSVRRVMLVKRIAGQEIPGQAGVARMAGTAEANHAGGIQLGNSWIVNSGFGMRLLPFVVRFERTVTGFAAHGHFRHRCMVAVGIGLVIYFEPSVVTFGALGIPIHAPPCPVAEFTGMAEVVAIDIKPLV